MMAAANFFAVFVGIESPDPATLVAMQKKQNTRRNIAESIHKIYGAGMLVTAGFIVGFDSEKVSIADAMIANSSRKRPFPSAWSACSMPCQTRSSRDVLPTRDGCMPIMIQGRARAAISARMA